MADTALDLSKPSPLTPTEHVAPLPPTPKMREMSSDSGRASTSPTSSTDENRLGPSENDPRDADLDVKPPLPLLSPEPEDQSDEDIESGEERDMSDRVAPIRPFKMYPMDAYSMANTSFPGMPGVAGMSPTTVASFNPASLSAMSGMMDPASVSPFALTPMTSHLFQRKRRADNRNISLEDMKKMNPVPEEKKDDSYWERRRKNNEAAKRSRDARRMKEEEIAMRATFLEQENLKLRAQVAILKNETAKLHYMLYNRV